MNYWNARMASLGRKQQETGTPMEIVERCIETLKPLYPDHVFEFDGSYFRSISNGSGRRP